MFMGVIGLFTVSEADLDVFRLEGFEARMEAIRVRVRPKLEELGAILRHPLSHVVGEEMYPHVAKHMRRRTNPPPETWVAFGPSPRGYKAMAHLAATVGPEGLGTRLSLTSESRDKASFARVLRDDRVALPSDYRCRHRLKPGGVDTRTLGIEEREALAGEMLLLRDAWVILERIIRRDDPVLSSPGLVNTLLSSLEEMAPLYREIRSRVS
jgi:uncharacterized protein YktB (UPF0637 family)